MDPIRSKAPALSPALSVVNNLSLGNSASILGAAFSSLQDGLIVVATTGEIQQINQPAERICNLLAVEGKNRDDRLPQEIWHVCKIVLRRKAALSQKISTDFDIILPELGPIRIRVQTISFGQTPYLLIVLEDRQQTTRNKALFEATLYGLTEREAEVWQLRSRGHAYKEISATLWISLDTVKKHLKNIHAKQRIHQDELEYRLMA